MAAIINIQGLARFSLQSHVSSSAPPYRVGCRSCFVAVALFGYNKQGGFFVGRERKICLDAHIRPI